jgi:Cof subfamily protein (haloacid dehalogenase superfamily)
MTSRIAFLDVDGTLIDGGERIAPSTIDAVRTARANGHLVYLCTGRSTTEIYPAIREIGFDGAISAGGGYAQIGEELVISRTMPEEAVLRMAGFYEDAGYDYYFQSFGQVYPSPGMHDRLAAYLRADRARAAQQDSPADAASTAGHEEALAAFARVQPLDPQGIAKSVFLADDLAAFARVSAELGEEFHVITGTIPHMGSGSGEVTLGGVNKGTTIVRLMEMLGRDLATSIGIGDSSNDIEMLQLCGVGIAMGNADAAIKAHADEVTTAVLDDGVWNAFRRHGLI